MPRVGVRCDDGVKLHDAEAQSLRGFQTVEHELLADVKPSCRRADGIARVSDVPAAADVVGVQNVKPQYPAGFIRSDAARGLGSKKFCARRERQLVFLRVGIPSRTTSFQISTIAGTSAGV